MRSTWNVEIGINEYGFFAINLGSDFCAEHEIGIESIKRTFGINDIRADGSLKLGVEKRTITLMPSNLEFNEFYYKNKKYVCITTYFGKDESISKFKNLPLDLFPRNNADVTAAWDDRNFGILATGKENIKHLKELYQAFKNLDVSIWIAKEQPFKGGGLVISIPSRLDKLFLEQLEEQDLNAIKLEDAVLKTGIIKKLQDADKDYYLLRSRWANDEKTEIKFYLNPMNQDKYKSGWCTLKDLEDWIEEKGPIVRNGGIDK